MECPIHSTTPAPSEDHQDVFARYGVKGYPTTFLLDSEGKIVWDHVGFGDELRGELENQLQKLGISSH